MTPIFNLYLQIVQIFLNSVTFCTITHPDNPKYLLLQNKNKFHVNANGCMRMHCLRHNMDKVFKLILEKLKLLLFI